MTDALPGSVAHAMARARPARRPLLLCLSHLRWDFVFQRPQHLLTRAARTTRSSSSRSRCSSPASCRASTCTPRRRASPSPCRCCRRGCRARPWWRRSVACWTGCWRGGGRPLVAWFYTPMALEFAAPSAPRPDYLRLHGRAVRLPRRAAADARPGTRAARAGRSGLHRRAQPVRGQARPAPAGPLLPRLDRCRAFRRGAGGAADPADQAALPHPRIGFFGVVDERMDLDLVGALAAARPDWAFVMIGPVVKIDPAACRGCPTSIGWAASAMPSCRPISRAGTPASCPSPGTRAPASSARPRRPEFLAAGLPVVSTPITDVVRDWGPKEDGGPGLVEIAAEPVAFAAALQAVLDRPRGPWLKQVDRRLAQISWDRTWAEMRGLHRGAAGGGASAGAGRGGGAERLRGKGPGRRYSPPDPLVSSHPPAACCNRGPPGPVATGPGAR